MKIPPLYKNRNQFLISISFVLVIVSILAFAIIISKYSQPAPDSEASQNPTSYVENEDLIGCRGDYNKTGTIDIADFGVFAQNYKTQGMLCVYDIAEGNCYLNITDFKLFAALFKVKNACKAKVDED